MSILKLKDSQGNWVGVPTIKGDNGTGISSAVLNNDYTLTLTFTDGTTYTTPSIRGEKGQDGDIQDVQINGTSIVSNGVANVPIATGNQLGVVGKPSNSYGILINASGQIFTYCATDSDIKNGTSPYRPLNATTQHKSVFYGLAKVAGDVTQSASNNAVGEYTNEAKSAIKSMLGVHDAYDSFIEEVTGTSPTIVGQPSYRYNCGEVLSLTITPPPSGTIDVIFTSGSTPTVLTLPNTVKMPDWWVDVEANTTYELCITDATYGAVMSWAI